MLLIKLDLMKCKMKKWETKHFDKIVYNRDKLCYIFK